uniref:S100/CaBP-9k-type calcium binding subdomain domain-containing protein n=1 Tax=Cyprinodon variegatus TaxID=28743 RepID=A0A3Q2E0J6_CYPVA
MEEIPPAARRGSCLVLRRHGDSASSLQSGSEFLGCLSTVESEEGLGHVLQQMGVTSGENISFEDVWTLINKQAVQVFKNTPPEKGVKCNCLLQ